MTLRRSCETKSKNGDVKVVYKDVFELTKADLAGFDAVISAFAA